ncbi:MAG: hypothetical protein J6W75_06945 [Bacteroidaceae bacterium]|nr:hypothetical protein [Bacteroidaceae bacterium]
MKKIITSITLFCASLFAFVAQAQDAVFQFQGQELEDGATINIAATEDPLFGWLTCDTNPSWDADNGLFLVNKTSRKLSCDGTVTIQTNTLKGSSIQWCMGQDCMQVKGTSLSKSFDLPASSKIMAKFDCEPNQEGEMLTKLEVKINGKTYTVNIHFVYSEEANVGAANAQKPVALEFYTLDGRRIDKQPRGISLARFSDGKVRKVVLK